MKNLYCKKNKLREGRVMENAESKIRSSTSGDEAQEEIQIINAGCVEEVAHVIEE